MIKALAGLDRLAVAMFLAATLAAALVPPALLRSGTVGSPRDAVLAVFPISGFVYAWSVMRMLGDPRERPRTIVVVIFLVLWCFGVFVSDFVSRATLRRKPDYRHLEERLRQREGTPPPAANSEV